MNKFLKFFQSKMAYVVLVIVIPMTVVLSFAFFPYSPKEVTELHIPAIMQGDTDWGRSNIFAATVMIYIVCGFIGTYIFTCALHFKEIKTFRNIIIIYWILFLYTNTNWIRVFLKDTYCDPKWLSYLYFNIDTLGTQLLFLIIFILSSLWILFLRRRSVRTKFLLAPLVFLVFMYLSSDGITEKSGHIISAGTIPKREIRSWKHKIMLLPRDFITYQTLKNGCPDVEKYLESGTTEERRIRVGQSFS